MQFAHGYACYPSPYYDIDNLGVLLTYVPLYYYRKLVEDRRAVGAPAEEAPTRFA